MDYFSDREFECPCCGRSDIHVEFRSLLNKARHEAGIPFVISSGGGFRCEDYNTALYLPDPPKNSAHLRGRAADISVKGSSDRFQIVRALLLVGFRRVGVYNKHIHADLDSTLDQQVLWTGRSK